MTLTIETVRTLQLKPTRARRMRLADGSARRIPTYSATIIWHGAPMTIPALTLPGKPLVGMSLLWNSDLAMAVRENGPVSITEPSET